MVTHTGTSYAFCAEWQLLDNTIIKATINCKWDAKKDIVIMEAQGDYCGHSFKSTLYVTCEWLQNNLLYKGSVENLLAWLIEFYFYRDIISYLEMEGIIDRKGLASWHSCKDMEWI